MKIISTLLIIALVNVGTFAQVPSWLWAKSAGGTDDESGYGITTDASGAVSVIGTYRSSSITFGSYTLTNSNPGIAEIFVVKYDAAGNVLWAESVGGTSYDWGQSIFTDGGGNVFITGVYSGSIILGNDTLTTAGTSNAFVLKYDPSGNIVWARGANGTGIGIPASMSTDLNGNILVAGSFYGSYITFGNNTLTNAGGSDDIFVVKYDAAGNVVWARSAGGTNNDFGEGISTDAAGNVVITGYFGSTSITFGSYTLTTPLSTSSVFVVKYDASGNVVWANSAGGVYNDAGFDIATDANGNVIVTGEFEGSTITFSSYILNNAYTGNHDMFVVKYDASGNVLWAKSAGGLDYDDGYSISTDASDNVFVSGFYSSTSITFGSYTLTNANSGYQDIYIVKYDSSGNVVWATSKGGTNHDYAWDMSTDASGNVCITGQFQSAAITFGSTTLINAGNNDILTAKLSGVPTGITETVSSGNSILVYPNIFSNSTTISFSFEQTEKVSVRIYDVNGRLVTTLADKVFEEGENNIKWNAEKIENGIYFLKMETQSGTENRKLMVIK